MCCRKHCMRHLLLTLPPHVPRQGLSAQQPPRVHPNLRYEVGAGWQGEWSGVGKAAGPPWPARHVIPAALLHTPRALTANCMAAHHKSRLTEPAFLFCLPINPSAAAAGTATAAAAAAAAHVCVLVARKFGEGLDYFSPLAHTKALQALQAWGEAARRGVKQFGTGGAAVRQAGKRHLLARQAACSHATAAGPAGVDTYVPRQWMPPPLQVLRRRRGTVQIHWVPRCIATHPCMRLA